MSNLTAAKLAIDPVHCRAICDEIGERLRYALKQEVSDIPPKLLMLIDKLAELECAPSIVPSIDEMLSVTAEDQTFKARRAARTRRLLTADLSQVAQ
jgi:hypothetical protein